MSHLVEILVAAGEVEDIKTELMLGLGGRVVDALEICDDPHLSAEEKVTEIREIVSGRAS